VTAFPTKPAHGTVSITDAGKTVTYDPAGCYVGSDSFQYTITDGSSTDTATVFVGVSRPGQHGFATTPMTDTPNAAFVSNSTIGTTVPLKLSWCGVTTSTTSVRSYHVVQSTNAGSTYPTTLYSATTARSAVRNATVNTSYRWKAQTVDTASRKGAYRASLVSRVRRIQDTSSAIGYTGSWVTSTTSSASGGSEKASKASGATATLTVSNARSFAIVGPRSSTRGSFRVYVDGTLVATVSEKATTTVYRRVLYVRNITSTQSHVIRIVAASSARIDLDAILTLSAQ
jgi:hypothetical protein